MRWGDAVEAVFDPWKLPAYIAGIALVGFVGVVLIKPEPTCDAVCHLQHIKMTLQRIERKLDLLDAEAKSCRGTNWNLPYIPSQRDI